MSQTVMLLAALLHCVPMGRKKKDRSHKKPSARPAPARLRRQIDWWVVVPALVAMALAGLVYLNAMHNPFVYDDLFTVVGNASIRDLGNPVAIVLHDVFRPVVNLSYAIDYAMWGLQPFGFHLSSILIHMLNVLLLFVVARRLVEDRQALASLENAPPWLPVAATFTAAAALGVHPMMTEAVGYTSARSELLCTAFLLGGFLCLRRFLLTGGGRFLAAGLCLFVAGGTSKETAAMLPFMLLAWEYLVAPGSPEVHRRRLLRFHLPFTTAVILAGLVRVVVYLGVEQGGRVQDLWHNALVEVTVLWRYLFLLVAPFKLSVVHSVRSIDTALDPAVLASLLGLVLLAGLLFFFRARAPLAVLGFSWFLLLFAPSHVIPLQEAMAEHRIYTAGCGIFLVLAGLVLGVAARCRGGTGFRWILAAAAVVLLTWSGLTVARNRVWSDPVLLWGDAAAKAPDTWAAHYAHGDALRAAGRCDEAVPAYRRAIEILPGMVEPYLNAGICLADRGEVENALLLFERARELAPDSPQPLNNLGVLAARGGRLDEARALFGESLKRDPENQMARRALDQLEQADAYVAP